METSRNSATSSTTRFDSIEPGSGENSTISQMIADDKFGLKDFELVESSEQRCWRR